MRLDVAKRKRQELLEKLKLKLGEEHMKTWERIEDMEEGAGKSMEVFPKPWNLVRGNGGDRNMKRKRGKKPRWTEEARRKASLKGVTSRRYAVPGRLTLGEEKKERLQVAKKKKSEFLTKLRERTERRGVARFQQDLWKVTRGIKTLRLLNVQDKDYDVVEGLMNRLSLQEPSQCVEKKLAELTLTELTKSCGKVHCSAQRPAHVDGGQSACQIWESVGHVWLDKLLEEHDITTRFENSSSQLAKPYFEFGEEIKEHLHLESYFEINHKEVHMLLGIVKNIKCYYHRKKGKKKKQASLAILKCMLRQLRHLNLDTKKTYA